MSGDYLSAWPLERARLEFHHAGRVIDAAAEVPGRGWVLLWHTDDGYSVSYTSETWAGTGDALPLAGALAEFRQGLDLLLPSSPPTGEKQAECSE